MNAISVLPDPSGLYVLSPEGSLGVYLSPYTDSKKFSVDSELSAELSGHIADFLKTYQASPEGSAARVAIVYHSAEKKPWGHATFFMEKSVVRDVYPVTGLLTGGGSSALTSFQQRNREKSIYRGMETLLAHKATSNLAIYCPVLFDRNTTLDCYLATLGREEQEGDRKTPVLEVLNLVANVPVLARNSPAILDLREKLHAVLIKSHMRKESGLAVVDAGAPPAVSAPLTPDAVSSIRPSATRARPGSESVPAALRAASVLPMKDFSRLHVSDRHEHIERLLLQPSRAVDSVSLQAFTPFRGLSDQYLLRISYQCPIYQAPAGTRLLERGMNDKWNLFLLNGALLLEAQDGAVLTLESGTERAASPVSSLKPRKYQVVAKTPVTFLWVPDALLHALATSTA